MLANFLFLSTVNKDKLSIFGPRTIQCQSAKKMSFVMSSLRLSSASKMTVILLFQFWLISFWLSHGKMCNNKEAAGLIGSVECCKHLLTDFH